MSLAQRQMRSIEYFHDIKVSDILRPAAHIVTLLITTIPTFLIVGKISLCMCRTVIYRNTRTEVVVVLE